MAGGGGPAGATTTYENGAWYICDPDGDWVFNPETPGSSSTWILRADVSRTDTWMEVMGVTGLSSFDWSPLDQRFYYSGTIGDFSYGGQTPPTVLNLSSRVCQFLLGNTVYLYRNYGYPLAKALIWPRNYADIQPRDSLSFNRAPGYYTLQAKHSLEGTPAMHVTYLTTDQDPLITALPATASLPIENSWMQVWQEPLWFQ